MIGGTRLERLFEVSLYLIILIPFVLIAIGSGVGPLMGAFFVVALIGSWFAHQRGFAKESHQRWWSASILAFIIITFLQVVFGGSPILESGIRFVLVLTLIKLWNRLSARDEHQLYLLSFILLAAATTVNEDLAFGVLFSIYVIIGTFSLAVFHLRNEMNAHPRVALKNPRPLNRPYMMVLMVMSIAILLSSAGIFFAFPRIGLGFFIQQNRDGVAMTGFSEDVELGKHGVIRDNPQVVLRAEFPGGEAPPLGESFHWRMMSFDRYDGLRWERTLDLKETPLYKRRKGFSGLDLLYPTRRRDLEEETRIEVYLEPLNTNVLPTLWPSRAVRLGSSDVRIPFDPKSGDVTRDTYNDLRHTVESKVGISYGLWTGLPKREGDPVYRILKDPPPAFLQLPEFSPRFRQTVDQLVVGLDDPDDKARAVAEYLSQLTYTTDLPKVEGNPVEAFLFETKRGHCEYFATSAVMMLREADVPARLVNGFLGGQWNDVGNYWAVREGDAHSWVEYWDPDRGWILLDPTPAAELTPPNPLLTMMRQYTDAARLAWMKWVIEYDLRAQIELAQRVGRVFRPDGLLKNAKRQETSDDERKDFADTVRGVLPWFFLVAFSLFGAFAVRERRLRGFLIALTVFSGASIAAGMWFIGSGALLAPFALVPALTISLAWRFWGIHDRHDPHNRLQAIFREVERASTRLGIVRSQDEGPRTFLLRLAEAYPAMDTRLRKLAETYLYVRYSDEPISTETLMRVEALAQSVIKELRSKK